MLLHSLIKGSLRKTYSLNMYYVSKKSINFTNSQVIIKIIPIIIVILKVALV